MIVTQEFSCMIFFARQKDVWYEYIVQYKNTPNSSWTVYA